MTPTPANDAVLCQTEPMSERWSPEHLLAAVRTHVPWVEVHLDDGALDATRAREPQVFTAHQVHVQVGLDGDDILVTFRWPGEPHLFGIRFPASEAPNGPSTGGTCETPAEWAQEVGLVLMEELDTGLVHRGQRTLTPNGVVELDYHHDDPAFQSRSGDALPSLPEGHYYRVTVSPPPGPPRS